MTTDNSGAIWAFAPIDLSMSGVNCVVTSSKNGKTNNTEVTNSVSHADSHSGRHTDSHTGRCVVSRVAGLNITLRAAQYPSLSG